ncbi:DUF924 family protein [Methylobrevis albus]|uniref:DUF924 family protein n=1 Tax=Methylobrevis albus TaxID=2793297 RepID=A0A931MY30_9HYPH|nr:DUF924 family protein [Methylobrevis albus]MBH0236291.1 DUF924 family protein [Methylobrevis albus]
MTDPAAAPRHDAVCRFWREAGREAWFTKDPAFDRRFRDRFIDLHLAVARREHDDWIETPEGALALMLLLDQFPRNVFRGTGHMYATDPLARHFARLAVGKGHQFGIEVELRVFLFLPFSHSEALADQELAVALHRAAGDAEGLHHALGHRDIVARFGRFPHRNAILARDTTEAERAFLDAGGFSG